MNSGEDMGDGLNKYPEQFFDRNNARKNRYEQDYYNPYEEKKYDFKVRTSGEIFEDESDYERSPYLSYDPYENKGRA